MAVQLEPPLERRVGQLADEVASAAGVSVKGMRVDVDLDVGTSNAVVIIVTLGLGVGAAVLTHCAITTPANNISSVSNSVFLATSSAFLRCLGCRA